MRDHMLDSSGVIVRALNDGLVMCPPLVIRDEHIDQMVDAVAAAAA
jgi:adenosylmethionine-8-amino-7-oxononanoate aminotransferase